MSAYFHSYLCGRKAAEWLIKMDERKLIISPRKYKGETSVVSTRLPVEMIKNLDSIAEKTGRNRNEIIMLCLEYAIDNLIIKHQ